MTQTMLQITTVAAADAANPRNDTASVIELRDGRLMLVYQKYEDGPEGGSDFGYCRIVALRSADGGLTWGEPSVIAEPAPGDHNVQAPGLSRLSTGELLLHCLRGHEGGSSTTMCLFRSSDEGETWQEAGTVWERSPGQWLQGGANHLNVLTSGRLLLPFHFGTGHQGSQHNQAACYLSDDHGRSWFRSDNVVDLPMRGAMEASVAELDGGRLAMSLRTQLGAVFMSFSEDGGANWSLPQTTGIAAPESCSCLRRLPGTGDLILFFSGGEYDPGRHHYGLRTPLGAALSADGGRSWRHVGLIEQGPYEFMNLNCLVTASGQALLTYTKVVDPQIVRNDRKLSFQRTDMDLRLAIIEPAWFYEQETGDIK